MLIMTKLQHKFRANPISKVFPIKETSQFNFDPHRQHKSPKQTLVEMEKIALFVVNTSWSAAENRF